eukprot:4426006-Ditylum_brightwellii.AAC.1
MGNELDIHWSDEDGYIQLHEAVYYGNRDRVEKLLSLGAENENLISIKLTFLPALWERHN